MPSLVPKVSQGSWARGGPGPSHRQAPPRLCFTRQTRLGGWVWCYQVWAIRPGSQASPAFSPPGSTPRPQQRPWLPSAQGHAFPPWLDERFPGATHLRGGQRVSGSLPGGPASTALCGAPGPGVTVFTWSHFWFLQVEATHSHLHGSAPDPVSSASDPPPEGRC